MAQVQVEKVEVEEEAQVERPGGKEQTLLQKWK